MEKLFYYVNAGLSRITSTGLVEKVRNCITMSTGNPNLPATTTPPLADLTAVSEKLDKANGAYDFTRSKLDKDVRDSTFAELKGMVHEFAGFVQSVSNGNREVILSTGLDVRRSPQVVGLLPAPTDVRALVTAYPGRLEVRWKGVPKRMLYELYMAQSDAPDAEWTLLVQTTKNRHVVDDLESNAVYYFRLITIGTAGSSPVSDIAKAKAA